MLPRLEHELLGAEGLRDRLERRRRPRRRLEHDGRQRLDGGGQVQADKVVGGRRQDVLGGGDRLGLGEKRFLFCCI